MMNKTAWIVLVVAGMAGISALASRPVIQETDFDGDGKSDFALYQAGTGNWQFRYSRSGTVGVQNWGSATTLPVPGDYDGDRKADLAVYQPATGLWSIKGSAGRTFSSTWGGGSSVPVPADYDGDGKTDLAVYQSAAGMWSAILSGGGTLQKQWGWGKVLLVPEDYDGDLKADPAVFDPSNAMWYVAGSLGRNIVTNWGRAGFLPAPMDFDGDGHADLCVYDPAAGVWYVRLSTSLRLFTFKMSSRGGIPMGMVFDGDRRPELTTYNSASGIWSAYHTVSRRIGSRAFGGPGWNAAHAPLTFTVSGPSLPPVVPPVIPPVIPPVVPPVTPPPPTTPQVPADFRGVTWLHNDVSKWRETATLSSVTVGKGSITLNYDKARVWPAQGSPLVNANPWIFIPREDGKGWYAATWEWLRPGQTTKARSSVAGNHIKRSPLQSWKPKSGEYYGFMVSGLARDKRRNVLERSNVVMVKWP